MIKMMRMMIGLRECKWMDDVRKELFDWAGSEECVAEKWLYRCDGQ